MSDELLIDDREFNTLYLDKRGIALKGSSKSGNFGHAGRPGHVGGSSRTFGRPVQSSAMMRRIQEADGGFTYDAQTGKLRTDGFVVAIHSDRERVIDAKEVTLATLVEYAKANQDLLTQTNKFLGGWHNPENGKVYLDVSTVVSTAAEAEALGRQFKQIAYFDMAIGKSVNIVYDDKDTHAKAAREATHLPRWTGEGSADPGELDRLNETADWQRSHTRGDRSRPSLFSRILKGLTNRK